MSIMEISLSSSNLEWLIREVMKAGITYSHLQEELIDHICCDVEQEMQGGLSFEQAYAKVRDKVGIGGLERIQEDTLYIIDKKYRIMKNTMKISGMLAPILLVLGTIFKIQHLPVAGILMVAGFVTMAFVFLPSAMYVSYKEVSNKTRKWTHIAGFLGIFFTMLGFLFKVQHWPLTALLLVTGFVLIILVFLPLVALNRFRETGSVPAYIYVLAMLGLILSLAGFLFKMMHWAGAGMLFLTGIILLAWISFPDYVMREYKSKQAVAGSFIYLVVIQIWFIVPITLISLNGAPPVSDMVESGNQSLTSDLVLLRSHSDSIMAGFGEDTAAIRLHVSATELIAAIEKEVLLISQTGNPKDLLKSSFAGSENRFEGLAVAISSDLQYRNMIKQFLKPDQEIPHQTVQLRINWLIRRQHDVAVAEQIALLERLRLLNKAESNQ